MLRNILICGFLLYTDIKIRPRYESLQLRKKKHYQNFRFFSTNETHTIYQYLFKILPSSVPVGSWQSNLVKLN